MPDMIDVGVWEAKHPKGQTVSRGGSGGIVTVLVPSAVPNGNTQEGLDDAALVAFDGQRPSLGDPLYSQYDEFTIRSIRDIVVHEMGHVVNGTGVIGVPVSVIPEDTPGSNDNRRGVRRAMHRVSVYAARNSNEFLAESWTRLYRGETLAPDSMALYRHMKGRMP